MSSDAPLWPRAATPRAASVVNDQSIVQQILTRGPSSRAELAKLTGLSRPTASEAVERLVASGILIPTGEISGRPGRVAKLYSHNPARAHSLAVAIEPGEVIVRSTDLSGATLAESSFEEAEDLDEATLTEHVLRLGAQVSEQCESPCLAAVASVPAPVDPTTQQPWALPHAPLLAVHTDIRSILRRLTTGAVHVDNDVNFAARAECIDGHARGLSTVLYFYLGAGLGGALTSGDTVIRGAHGTAGEIGYLPSGDSTLVEQALAIGPASHGRLDVSEIRRLCLDGNADDRPARLSALISRSLGTATILIDPDAVIIGGPLSHIESFVARIRADLAAIPTPTPLDIRLSCHGGEGPLLGAVAKAQQLLSDQIWAEHAMR